MKIGDYTVFIDKRDKSYGISRYEVSILIIIYEVLTEIIEHFHSEQDRDDFYDSISESMIVDRIKGWIEEQ